MELHAAFSVRWVWSMVRTRAGVSCHSETPQQTRWWVALHPFHLLSTKTFFFVFYSFICLFIYLPVRDNLNMKLCIFMDNSQNQTQLFILGINQLQQKQHILCWTKDVLLWVWSETNTKQCVCSFLLMKDKNYQGHRNIFMLTKNKK